MIGALAYFGILTPDKFMPKNEEYKCGLVLCGNCEYEISQDNSSIIQLKCCTGFHWENETNECKMETTVKEFVDTTMEYTSVNVDTW